MKYLLLSLLLLCGCQSSFHLQHHNPSVHPPAVMISVQAVLMYGSNSLSNERNLTLSFPPGRTQFTLGNGDFVDVPTFGGVDGQYTVDFSNNVLRVTIESDGSEGVWVVGAIAN